MVISAASGPWKGRGSEAYLRTASDAAVVAAEGDALVLDDDVPQVLVGFADVHAFDGLGRLTCVLVRKKQITTSAGSNS